MVTNYDRLCGYSLGDLAHEVYFYAFNKPKIEYTMDDNDYQKNGIATSIEGNSIKMYCDRVTFSTETSSDNRYAFKNKLNLQLLERTDSSNSNIIKFLLSNKLLAVFCDREGNKWILNPEFPITINYTYNITDTNNNITSIDLISNSNVPPLIYLGATNFSDIIRDKAKRYNVGKVKKLELASIYDIFFKNTVSGFQIIEKGIGKRKNIHFDKGSLNFKEEYDGSDFKQTLTFNIPFKKYKSYFHIDLLEYVDNKYYALIKTTNDNLIIGGYRQGMFPEFTINTTEDNNSIAITLSAIYQNYNLLTTDSSESIRIDDVAYDKIEGECIDNIFTYTLLQKRINGKITNDYYCLSGYENKYPTFNIVGTYSSNSTEFGKIKDFNINCSDKCDIQGLPTSIIFKEINEVKTFNVSTDCQLTFEYDSTKVDVTFVNGVLTVTNKIKKGDYNITVKLSDGTRRNIAVRADENAGTERTINITAKAQNVDIKASKGVNNVIRVDTTLPYSQNQSGNGYIVSVTENKDTINKKTFDVTIIYNDGTQDIIHIIQDKLYKKLAYDGTNRCFGNDMYEMWVEKVGYTPDKIDISHGYIKGQLFEKNSSLCIDYDEENVKGTLCVKGVLYNIVEYKKNGAVITTKLQLNGEKCDDSTTKYEYRINREKATCINGTPYYLEELYASADGINWYLVTPIIQRPTNEIATDSNVCEVIYPDKGKTIYRWYNGGDTYCLPEDKETNCEKVESITPKPGDINTYLCDGKDKWSIKAKYISPLCDNKYRFVGYEKDKLIEENSSDCTQDINDDLAFEYSGSTPMKYKINNVVYTANQSPFSISTKNDLGINSITSMSQMFDQGDNPSGVNPNNITRITKIPNTSKVTNMFGMFYDCFNLIELDLSNFNTSNVAYMSSMFNGCKSLPSLDLSNFNTSNVINMNSMFSECRKLTSLNLTSFNTSNVTDMDNMFESCRSLTNVDLSSFDTSNVIDMHRMFAGCDSLTSLNLTSFNTSKVNDMNYMFGWCEIIGNLNLSSFDTSNVTDMNGMFVYCSSLTTLDLSNFNTSNVTNMHWMFGHCTALTELKGLSNFNTSNVTNMEIMFEYCESLPSLDLSNFNTSKVTDMAGMFEICSSLNNVDLSSFDTSNVTSMNEMFLGCSSLNNVDLSNFNTSKVTYMGEMFQSCSSLASLDLSSFDTSNVTYMSSMFLGCSSLTSLDLSNWVINTDCKTNVMFRYCTALKTITMNNCSCETIKRIQDQLVTDKISGVTIYSNTGCAGTVPTPTEDDLAFEFSGSTPMKYTINGTQYTANQSPFSINTKNDLGIDKITSMHSMFLQGYSINPPEYITKITKIPDASNVSDMSAMFHGCYKLTSLNISNLNTSNVTDMRMMFYLCSSLTSLDVSHFDTSKVTDMENMFARCNSLSSLNISNIDTSKVTNASYLFYDCTSLKSLDVSKFNTSNMANMSFMFNNCTSLTSLDLSNFNTSKAIDMAAMFYNCPSLISLDLSNWDIKQECPIANMFVKCNSLTSITMNNCSCETIQRIQDEIYSSNISGVTIYSNTGCAGTVPTPAEDDLAFEFSGDTPMIYRINRTKYSADKSPFSVNTKNDLGISDITSMNTMFGQGYTPSGSTMPNNITKITKIPDSSRVTDMSFMFHNCISLTELDLRNLDTRNVNDMGAMFADCHKLTSLDISNFNTSNATEMTSMFNNCEVLPTLDLSNFDTFNVVSMDMMFYNCKKLQSLDLKNFNTSNVVSMERMFQNCTSLSSLDLSSFNTSKTISMGGMFYYCSSLPTLDLSNFDTSKVTDLYYMFYNCSSLKSLNLSNWNTSFCKNMSGMFQDCKKIETLNISHFDTSSCEDMSHMFRDLFKIQALDLSNFNTSKVIDMTGMFDGCSKITTLNLSSFNISNVTDMFRMFFACKSLTTLDLSNWNIKDGCDIRYMFGAFEGNIDYRCSALKTITMKNCSQATVDKIKAALSQSRIPKEQVTIIR